MVVSEPDLVKLLVAIMTLLGAIIGVLDPGALSGNTTNFVTNFLEDSGSSDHDTFNMPSSVSDSSSKQEKTNVVVVSPQPARDTSSTDKTRSHHNTANKNIEKMEDPKINSFDVTDGKIVTGESTTLSWSVSDATDIVISSGIGHVKSSGSKIISPTETTTYTITAINEAGSDKDAVTVSVEGIEPPKVDSKKAGGNEDTPNVSVKEIESPTIDSFEVYPEEITAGDSSTLSWSVPGDADVNIEPDIGSVSPTGSISVNPTETTTYAITATNEAGSDNATVVVSVKEIESPTIDSFEVYPEEITAGDSSTLSWSVPGDADVNIEPDIGSVSPTGSISVNPTETTTYTITATNEVGSDDATAVVSVKEIESPTADDLGTDYEENISEEGTEF